MNDASIVIIRQQSYTDGVSGWVAIGNPITDQDSGIATRVRLTLSPVVGATPIIDGGITHLGIMRDASPVYSIPVSGYIYKDITGTSDYFAGPISVDIPVFWELLPGDQVVGYLSSANGIMVHAALDIMRPSITSNRRTVPLPGDGKIEAATWAMPKATSTLRWRYLRALLLGGLLLISSCATQVVTVTCRIHDVQGSRIGMSCRPGESKNRLDGEFELTLPKDVLDRQGTSEANEKPNTGLHIRPTGEHGTIGHMVYNVGLLN